MMSFWKKLGHLYDKMGYQPEQGTTLLTTTGFPITRRYL